MKLDRRNFLECMAWAGTGLVWTVSGGVLSSRTIAHAGEAPPADFTFAQISDTHIGFKGQANADPVATMQESIARLNGLTRAPAFVIHTGDLTHAQKPGAFDTVTEGLKSVRAERVFYAPGENDVFLDGGKEYLGRFPGVDGHGWQSFDYKGVHFVGLVNVLNYKTGGIGALGTEQIEWLEKDVAKLGSSTPIVVFTHVVLRQNPQISILERRDRSIRRQTEDLRLVEGRETASPDVALAGSQWSDEGGWRVRRAGWTCSLVRR